MTRCLFLTLFLTKIKTRGHFKVPVCVRVRARGCVYLKIHKLIPCTIYCLNSALQHIYTLSTTQTDRRRLLIRALISQEVRQFYYRSQRLDKSKMFNMKGEDYQQ